MKISVLTIFIGMIILTGSINAEVNMKFEMPCCMFEPGSPFFVNLRVENSSTQPYWDLKLYTALTLGTGDYWFYPDWKKYPPEASYVELDLTASNTVNLAILSQFNWPSGAGNYYGARFLSAALLPNGYMISNVADSSFGWLDTSPCNCKQTNFDWFISRHEIAKSESLTFSPLCTGLMHLVFDGGYQAVLGEWYEAILEDDQGSQIYYNRQYVIDYDANLNGFITISDDVWINLSDIGDYTFTIRVGGGIRGPTLAASGKIEFLAE